MPPHWYQSGVSARSYDNIVYIRSSVCSAGSARDSLGARLTGYVPVGPCNTNLFTCLHASHTSVVLNTSPHAASEDGTYPQRQRRR